MFVCANDRCDYLQRVGGVQRTNQNAEKYPSTALRNVAIFSSEIDARARCLEVQGAPAKSSKQRDNLRPMLLSEFGQQADQQWRAMIAEHNSATGSTYSDLDAF